MPSNLRVGRRQFLAGGVAAGAALVTPAFLRDALAAPAVPGPGPYGPLLPPDANGLRLPQGFTSRQIARGGELVGSTNYPWHFAPDGQATFKTADGGYILVTNSETPAALGGGSSAITFDKNGQITGAQRVLAGSNLNCAGGPTPWGTWLSGEEHEGGMIWEADPTGLLSGRPRPALGNFSHEAACVDRATGIVYLTEDQGNSCFYRFIPATPGDLTTGVLEAALVDANGTVSWQSVPDPNLVAQQKQVRAQVPGAKTFNGGEGLWYHKDVVYFTTKGDNKVWAYDTRTSTLDELYDRNKPEGGMLKGVDNVTVSPFGDVYVCEDGGDLEICLITPGREIAPFLQLTGADHQGSEMTGVVFDPSGTRMYFSSQRAYPLNPGLAGTPAAVGATYEVTGPFRIPLGGVPNDWIFHVPAGGARFEDSGPLAVSAQRTLTGVRATLTLKRPATVDLVLRSSDLRTEAWHSGGPDRPVAVTIARARESLGAGQHTVHLALPATLRSGIGATLTAVTTLGGQHSAVAELLTL